MHTVFSIRCKYICRGIVCMTEKLSDFELLVMNEAEIKESIIRGFTEDLLYEINKLVERDGKDKILKKLYN